MFKVVFYVPRASASVCKNAVFETGAGLHVSGLYSRCAFETEGRGSFFSLGGSTPVVGSVGGETSVEEVRVEVTCLTEDQAKASVLALCQVHPYQAPVIEVYPLVTFGGVFKRDSLVVYGKMSVEDVARGVQDRLAANGGEVSGLSAALGDGAVAEKGVDASCEAHVRGSGEQHGSGVLKGPNGGLSVGRGPNYERNQMFRSKQRRSKASNTWRGNATGLKQSEGLFEAGLPQTRNASSVGVIGRSAWMSKCSDDVLKDLADTRAARFIRENQVALKRLECEREKLDGVIDSIRKERQDGTAEKRYEVRKEIVWGQADGRYSPFVGANVKGWCATVRTPSSGGSKGSAARLGLRGEGSGGKSAVWSFPKGSDTGMTEVSVDELNRLNAVEAESKVLKAQLKRFKDLEEIRATGW